MWSVGKSLVYVQDSYKCTFPAQICINEFEQKQKETVLHPEGQRWGVQVMEKEYITIISEALVPTRIH